MKTRAFLLVVSHCVAIVVGMCIVQTLIAPDYYSIMSIPLGIIVIVSCQITIAMSRKVDDNRE